MWFVFGIRFTICALFLVQFVSGNRFTLYDLKRIRNSFTVWFVPIWNPFTVFNLIGLTKCGLYSEFVF